MTELGGDNEFEQEKAIVVAVGAALAAPCAYAQTAGAGDKWEIYGNSIPR